MGDVLIRSLAPLIHVAALVQNAYAYLYHFRRNPFLSSRKLHSKLLLTSLRVTSAVPELSAAQRTPTVYPIPERAAVPTLLRPAAGGSTQTLVRFAVETMSVPPVTLVIRMAARHAASRRN